MGVINNQLANQTTFNNAFMARNNDTDTIGVVGLLNTSDVNSGNSITNTQRYQNEIADSDGTVGEGDTTRKVYASNNVVADGDNRKVAIGKLDGEFDNVMGHAHSGAAGDGAPISSTTLIDVPLKGYILQGTDLTGVSGTSTVVTTQLTGKSASTGTTNPGVVVTAPDNKIVIRQATGASQDDVYKDGSGNIVYARLTFATSVWTLSYFVNISGTETAYSFSTSNVRWYYQELYNPLVNPPIYSEFASIPSDNATADVIDATQSLKGKVLLSNTNSADIAAAATVGTANATVSNADHTHRGVASIKKTGGTALYGDIELAEGTGIAIAVTTSPNKFTISASGGGGASARVNELYTRVIGSTAQVGTGAATDDTFASAFTAANDGDNILILKGSYTETVTITKKLNITGQGYGTVLTGDVTFDTGSDYSLLENLQLIGDVAFNPTMGGAMFLKFWIGASNTIIDNGVGDYIEGIQL